MQFEIKKKGVTEIALDEDMQDYFLNLVNDMNTQ